ncbi:DUF397 domain-containing protein [Streptomyces sp. NPDC002932]|uniref:DUF397 domain-containing protein n=1 Tax=Streptomyces sp. NPDC002932 TaxID=3364672 RepID=UPI0036B2D115
MRRHVGRQLGHQQRGRAGREGDSCVEVAACPTTVHIRDSKVHEGPQLALAPTAWTRFVGYAVQG